MARGTKVTRRVPDDRKPISTSYPLWVIKAKPRTKGPRRLLWWFWAILRLYKLRWIPQPRVHGTYIGRVLEMSKWIMDHRHVTQAIIAVFTTKGGACKTTTATWRSAIRAMLTRLAVILVDSDSGGGKVLKRFRLNVEKALTTNQLVEKHGAISYDELTRMTETDPATGVIVIHSPPSAEFPDDDLGITVVRLKHESHSVVIDCGPGFGKPNTDSVLRCADVIEIPANFQSSDNLDDVQATLDHEPYGLRKPGVIERVTVVVSAVRWWHFNYRTQFELAKRYGIEPEQVVLVPYSRYFQKDGPVNLDRLRPKLRFAYTLLDFRAGQIVEKNGRRKLPKSFGDNAEATQAEPSPQEIKQMPPAPVSDSTDVGPETPRSSATGWVRDIATVTPIASPGGGSNNGLVSAQGRE